MVTAAAALADALRMSRGDDLIFKYLPIATEIAGGQLNRFGAGRVDFDEMVAIGQATIVEMIRSGEYKKARHLRPFLIGCIKRDIIREVKRSHKYVTVKDDKELERCINSAPTSLPDMFDYDKAKEVLILLTPEEQKILEYKLQGMLAVEIGKRLGLGQQTISTRMNNIKRKVKRYGNCIDMEGRVNAKR